MCRITVEGAGRPLNLPKNAAQGNRFSRTQVLYFQDFIRRNRDVACGRIDPVIRVFKKPDELGNFLSASDGGRSGRLDGFLITNAANSRELTRIAPCGGLNSPLNEPGFFLWDCRSGCYSWLPERQPKESGSLGKDPKRQFERFAFIRAHSRHS